MSRLYPVILIAVLLAACSETNPPSLPVSTPPPGGDVLSPPVTDVPIPTRPPGSGVVSPPGGSTVPGPGGSDGPYDPQPGDGSLQRDAVYLESFELLYLESYPVQILLSIQGNLPDPCHQLRVAINPPNEDKEIHIEVYSVADPGQACILVLKPFEVGINLGSFPAGHYHVRVNGEPVGEFDS